MSATQELKVHEIAEVLPDMSDEELAAFERDVEQKGILEPIITYKGKIIDGRHRYRYAKKHGKDFEVKELTTTEPDYTELDALEFARSKNFRRRHMRKDKMAAAWAKTELLEAEYKNRLGVTEDAGETNGNGEEESGDKAAAVAEEFGFNRSYAIAAKQIAREKPELLDKITDGDMTLQEARAELPSVKKKAREREAKRREAGEPVFDDKQITACIKDLINLLDKRAKATKTAKALTYEAVVKAMDAVVAKWQKWQQETT